MTPYIKSDASITVGTRVASNPVAPIPALKKGMEVDINAKSATLFSSSVEFDNKGLNKEGYRYDDNKEKISKMTTGIAVAGPVGSIGAYPVTVTGGSKIEQTMQYGQVSSDKTEVSGGAAVGGVVGLFLSREVEQNYQQGTVTTVDRAGIINFGLSYGTIIVGEFNVSAGIKMTQKDE